MSTSPTKIREFKKLIWNYYKEYGRDLPWRKTTDPYKILVSEIMLQQTQVSRVIPKYKEFLKKFPNITALAEADRTAVLKVWIGLGYNRRALFLKRAAEEVVINFQSRFPKDRETLMRLAGIGQSTAGAIMAFSFNQPVTFIETNIRSVFLYHFFKEKTDVSDVEILPIIEQTSDTKNSREWYYALYDYGSMLKAKLGRQKTILHKQSKHYVKQSTFKGSNRQIRAAIVRYALEHPTGTKKDPAAIFKNLKKDLPHLTLSNLKENLKRLTAEGLI